MSWPRRLLNVFRSNRLSRDLDRELSFHMAESADDLRASGMSAAAAEREARRRLGNYALQKERTRDMNVLIWLDTLRADLRYALRALRSSPGFASVAVLSLALGIGANTAIFSLIDAVVLRSLPVAAPEELVIVTLGDDESESEPWASEVFTNPLWEQLRDRQDFFAGIAASGESDFNLATGGEARRVSGTRVSGDYFKMLGVEPALGRLIEARDDFRGCPAIAVLGGGFWQSEYGGARDVVGRSISLEGKPFEIVGVADPSFFGLTVGRMSNIFVPLCAERAFSGSDAALDHRSRWWLRVMGRPQEGMTLPVVQARLAALAPFAYEATVPERYSAEAKEEYRQNGFSAERAAAGFSDLRTEYGDALRILMVVVAIVLLIACANVANLLLARATVREREMAVRLAIGAGRGRIMRQLLTESVVLALISSLIGVAIAWWGSRTLVALISTGQRPVSLELPVDARVLGFTILVATTAAILFGLAPAWRAARSDPQSALRSGRGVRAGHTRFRAGRALVVGQIALSLAVVVTAGLLLTTFRTLSTMQTGFDSDRVLLVNLRRARVARDVDITPAEQAARERITYDALLERVRALPGVMSASASQITPVGSATWNDFVRTEGYEPVDTRDALAFVNEVTPGYFATLGTPLLAGRDFDERDRVGSLRVAIIDQAMARKFFRTSDVLGTRLSLGDVETVSYEVIGVVGNTKYQSLREETQPIVYLPRAQAESPAFSLTLEVRTAGKPEDLIAATKAAAADVEPSMTLQFSTLRQQLVLSLRRERLLAVLSACFGGLALLLAVIGLYGIIAYNVARRRGEIGIRMALGSERSRVLRMVLSQAGALLAIGLVFGTGLTLAGTRLVTSFLYGLEPNDPVTIASAAALFTLVGLLAGAIPAWRASRVEPITALRQE